MKPFLVSTFKQIFRIRESKTMCICVSVHIREYTSNLNNLSHVSWILSMSKHLFLEGVNADNNSYSENKKRKISVKVCLKLSCLWFYFKWFHETPPFTIAWTLPTNFLHSSMVTQNIVWNRWACTLNNCVSVELESRGKENLPIN